MTDTGTNANARTRAQRALVVMLLVAGGLSAATTTAPATAATTNSLTFPDTDGEVGRDPSMALDAAGNPVMAYQDASDGRINVLHCDDPNCEGVETPSQPDPLNFGALQFSLALDASGNPVIAYAAGSGVVNDFTLDLRVMHCNDPDCVGGDESIVTADADPNNGAGEGGVSLALDADGDPVVAYRMGVPASDLRVLRCNDPNCAIGGDIVTTPDTGNVGPDLQMRLDALGNPVVAYSDATLDWLKVLRCDDPTCDGTGETTTFPDDVPAATGRGISIVLDADGYPVISHTRFPGYPVQGQLRVVHCNDAACAGRDESVVTADVKGDGQNSSIALDASGFPVVAYRGNDTLRVLHCVDTTCTQDVVFIHEPSDGGELDMPSMALDAQGHPVVAHHDYDAADLRVLHCANPTCSPDGSDDTDGDGSRNGDDACPNAFEDPDGIIDADGCEETDADTDGVLDPVDACPLTPEDTDGVLDHDGCGGREPELVDDILPGPGDGVGTPMGSMGNAAYFCAGDGATGYELWKGTPTGAELVANINATDDPTSSSHPCVLVQAGEHLYFFADDGVHGFELWRSDGTETELVADINPGPSSGLGGFNTGLFGHDGRVYFLGDDGTGAGGEPWVSDGTTTTRLADTIPGSDGQWLPVFAAMGGDVYFLGIEGSLWRTNPTKTALELVTAGEGFSFTDMVATSDALYFSSVAGGHGNELWTSDGTTTGSQLLEIHPGPVGAEPVGMEVHGDLVYFAANDGVHGAELWRTDGTVSGTTLVRDVNPGSAKSEPEELTMIGDTLFFSAEDADHGTELWASDGSPAGTVRVRDIAVGTEDSDPGCFVAAGSNLVFSAGTPALGFEVWLSDGTAAGTVLTGDINPGPEHGSGCPRVLAGSFVYFEARTPSTGIEPWRLEVIVDRDADGVFDSDDNCPDTPNAAQENFDGDGLGDVCDPDDDNDGLSDADDPDDANADIDGDGDLDGADNCLTTPNSDQGNVDGDPLGDACDPDDDNDGLADADDPDDGNPDIDSDGDLDGADNCISTANPDQSNFDGDPLGDACDPDDDNDGLADADDPNDANADTDGDGDLDGADNCVTVANGDQANFDGDASGDACDADDDNDGLGDVDDPNDANADIDGDGDLDGADNCLTTPNASQSNFDGDSSGDACDADDDNDGLADGDDPNDTNPDVDGDGDLDGADNCLTTSNPSQSNFDGDPSGDACDPDDDNDGLGDGDDPDDANADIDSDGDLDGADNCISAANPDQSNFDGDASGDACDPDDDNDGLADADDPNDANADTDGDGDLDGADNCVTVANGDQANFDGDALGDTCDADDDNDGLTDASDPDDDNDGIADTVDLAPLATSDRFSDVALGGMTTGTVTHNGWVVTITDEASPEGVRVVVSGSGGQKVRIQLDGKPAVTRLGPGTYVVTDPELITTVETLVGGPAEVEVTLEGAPVLVVIEVGEVANIVEGADGSVEIQAITGTITVTDESGTSTVATIPPGESVGHLAELTGTLRMRVTRGTFDFSGVLTLGNGSDGINPKVDGATLDLGPRSFFFPPACFTVDRKGKATCSTTVSGAAVKIVLAPSGPGRYNVSANGRNVDLAGIGNAVTVAVTTGADTASTTVTASS